MLPSIHTWTVRHVENWKHIIHPTVLKSFRPTLLRNSYVTGPASYVASQKGAIMVPAVASMYNTSTPQVPVFEYRSLPTWWPCVKRWWKLPGRRQGYKRKILGIQKGQALKMMSASDSGLVSAPPRCNRGGHQFPPPPQAVFPASMCYLIMD